MENTNQDFSEQLLKQLDEDFTEFAKYAGFSKEDIDFDTVSLFVTFLLFEDRTTLHQLVKEDKETFTERVNTYIRNEGEL